MKRKIKLTRWFAKHFEWVLHLSQCLQNHTPNFRQKIIPKVLRTRALAKQPDHSHSLAIWCSRHPRQQASRQLLSVCECDGQIQFIKHQLRRIYKKNQLRQNGDLAGLDFVVNRTVCSVISGFRWSLESSFGYIMWKLVEYCFEASWHIFFSSNRSIWCISSSFEGNNVQMTYSNKRKQHIREKIELV